MRHQAEGTMGLRHCLSLAARTAWPVAALAVLNAESALAAGFALKEQSAAAQGNFFAGATAGADDVTYMFFNPAGLTRHAGNQTAAAASYIFVKGETFDADNGITGDPGERASGDAALDALAPGAYGLWSLGPDLKLAVGINAPFGLKTEYSPTWAGRYEAVESDMKTLNLNPAIAYRLGGGVSIGAGLQIQYIDVTLSNMVNFGGPDLLAEFSGDDWGVGATLGLLVELSDSTRLGVGYRSRVKHRIEGEFGISGVMFSDASADFTSPDTVTAGVYHDIDEAWAVMGEVGWTRWSTFDAIVIDSPGGVISQTPEDWQDVWFFAAGATWQPAPGWKLRGGIGYDQSPIPDNRRTPRITDENRWGIGLGVEFNPSTSLSLGLSYAHQAIRNASISLPGLTANYENAYDVVSVQAVYRF